MKRETKSTRNLRKELSKLSADDLESLVEMRILFKQITPTQLIRQHLLRKHLAQKLLESRFAKT